MPRSITRRLTSPVSLPSPRRTLLRGLFCAFACALVLTACGSDRSAPPAPSVGGDTAVRAATTRVEDLLGGPASVQLIGGSAATVTAYRIDGLAHMTKSAPEGATMVHDYPVLAGPVAVDAASRSALTDVLLNDSTYEWDSAKMCEFLPGVLVRYALPGADPEPELDVLLCFSCDELAVYRGDKQVGSEDFDSRRPDLVTVVKRLFPDDKQIQGLK